MTGWCNLHPYLKIDVSPTLMIIKLTNDPCRGTLTHGTLHPIALPAPQSETNIALHSGRRFDRALIMLLQPAEPLRRMPSNNVAGNKLRQAGHKQSLSRTRHTAASAASTPHGYGDTAAPITTGP